MKILVTGSNGFLGQHLCISLANKGFDVVATSRGIGLLPSQSNLKFQSVDVTNLIEVHDVFINERPDIVIHNAAMSKPDECDKYKNECLLQNVEATKIVVAAAQKINAHLIYVSTDFVFGENGPHSEDAIKAPLNFYGQSKLKAEEVMIESGLQYTIMRPVFIYGKQLPNMKGTFLHWVKNSLENKKAISVVNDQQRTPTFVNDICDGLIAIVERKATGDFHLAGKDILTPYQMAVILAKVLELDATLITPVTSETFVEPVIRAKKSGLKIDKAIRELNYQPVSFEEGVRLSFL